MFFSAALTKDNILDEVIDAKIALDNNLVPAKGRTLYAGSVAYTALLGCEEYIRLDALGSKSIVNGKVVAQDGHLLNIDEEKALAETRKLVPGVWERF